MILFVGLGNPGGQYAGNRHNIGFMAVEAIHRRHGYGVWKKAFQAEVSDGLIDRQKVLLMKPQTYMNESGRAVRAAMDFYKIALADVVVFHDELDLKPSEVKIKLGGGNAGHNGLKSITAHCGNEYRRVRLGIGHPGDKALVHNHVLSDFAKSDGPWLDDLMRALSEEAGPLAARDDSRVQGRLASVYRVV